MITLHIIIPNSAYFAVFMAAFPLILSVRIVRWVLDVLP